MNEHIFFCFLIIDQIPCIVAPNLIKQNVGYQKKIDLSDNHLSNFLSALKYQLMCEECNSDTFVERVGVL